MLQVPYKIVIGKMSVDGWTGVVDLRHKNVSCIKGALFVDSYVYACYLSTGPDSM